MVYRSPGDANTRDGRLPGSPRPAHDPQVEADLAREAEDGEGETPEFAGLAAEIRALRISALKLRLPDRRGHVVVDFKGPDEGRFWSSEYVDGKMECLDYD